MNFKFNQETLQKAIKTKDLALWVCVGLVISNILSWIKILNTEEKWVLIPQYDIDHRIEVTSSGRYSDDYYIDWASGVVSTLLSVNPDSVEWKNQQILKISTEAYGNLKDKLATEAQKIKKDQISTVFYPKKFKVDQRNQTVEVTGQHIAYFGKDSEPVLTEKTFRLMWAIRSYGVVLLRDFSEVKNEKN